MKPKAFAKLVRRLRKLGAIQVATPEGYVATFPGPVDAEGEAETPNAYGIGFVLEEEEEDDEVAKS